jgi:hypothetical protein
MIYVASSSLLSECAHRGSLPYANFGTWKKTVFVCLFSRFLFRYVPCKFTHTILQKITKTRPIFHEWIDRRHISFIRFLVTSDGYNQKTSSNKLTFVRLHFHYCVIYGGKTLFWVAVGCGLWRPSRPIFKVEVGYRMWFPIW